MEKGVLLKAEIREKTGSKFASKVRKQGQLPAIVYGHKKQPVAISLDAHSLMEELHHGHRLIDVQIGENPEKMIVKDIQYDHLGKNIVHLDLMRVDITERIKVSVPLELKGRGAGLQEGGIIEEHTNHLEVECLVVNIPESIAVSVKDMKIGDTIHARDVKLPEGVKLVSDPSTLLVACSMVAEIKTTEELEAEAPAAPEVITEVKPLEEEASEEDGEKKKG